MGEFTLVAQHHPLNQSIVGQDPNLTVQTLRFRALALSCYLFYGEFLPPPPFFFKCREKKKLIPNKNITQDLLGPPHHFQ